jgi:uncharacterized protein
MGKAFLENKTIRRDKMKKPKFVISKAKNGWQYYFVLKAPNGQPILTSEMYNSKASCKKGIIAIKLYARIALVVDTTLLEDVIKEVIRKIKKK